MKWVAHAQKGKKKSPEHAAKLRIIALAALQTRREKLEKMTPAERNKHLTEIANKAVATRVANKQKKLAMSQTSPAAGTTLPFPKTVATPAQVLDIAEAMGTAEPMHARAGNVVRTHWTMIESKTVAERAVGKMLKMGIWKLPTDGDRTGWGLMMDCCRDVQYDCLPKDRRRVAINSRFALNALFWDLARNAFAEAEKERQNKHVLGVVTPPGAAPAPVNGHSTPPMPKPMPPPPAASPFDSLIDARIKAAIEPMENLFMEEIERMGKTIDGLRAEIFNLRSANNSAPPPPKFPTVAVLGCSKDQYDFVVKGAKEAGLDLDLRYIDQGQSQINLTTEWAVFMRFTGHIQWDQVKATGIPNDKVAFCRGGVSSVVRQLEAWFKND